MIRAFIALLLPAHVQEALGLDIERLRRVARAVAWVAPANLHLTLKFLGAVEEPRIRPLVDGLATAAAGVTAFDLAVEGLGAFPSPARPRVIWSGVSAGAASAVTLAGRVDAMAAAQGFERETRPFSPHVTLGRVRAPRADPALAAALRAGAARAFGTARVDRVALMRSDLSSRGAKYTALALCELRTATTTSGELGGP